MSIYNPNPVNKGFIQKVSCWFNTNLNIFTSIYLSLFFLPIFIYFCLSMYIMWLWEYILLVEWYLSNFLSLPIYMYILHIYLSYAVCIVICCSEDILIVEYLSMYVFNYLSLFLTLFSVSISLYIYLSIYNMQRIHIMWCWISI